MSRALTPPTARIPIGVVQINGRQVEVQQHPEFVRFFFDLFARVGSTAALSNTELEELTQAITQSSSSIGAIRQALEAFEAIIADYRPAPVPAAPASSGGGSTVIAGAAVLTVSSVRGGVYEHEETFAAPGALAGMRVFLSLAAHSDADENHEQEISLTTISGEAAAGTITARLSFSEQTSGPIRINYLATP